ncbi:MAG: hypothetical protein OSB70_01370 [Myxococcota bacterium]|nr:hypothetical protein [Myxococcota bacterium]
MRVITRLHSLLLTGTLVFLVMGLAAPVALAEDGGKGDADAASSNFDEVVDKAFDVIVLRPLDAAALACGTVLMVPAGILGAIGGGEAVSDAWDLLVVSSWEALVDRPLGRWDS